MGSLLLASTTTGRTPLACWMPWASASVTAGATEAWTAARTSWVEWPAFTRWAVSVAAHSSGVREATVVSRHTTARRSPWNKPTVISVLPTSIARSTAPPRAVGSRGDRARSRAIHGDHHGPRQDALASTRALDEQ